MNRQIRNIARNIDQMLTYVEKLPNYKNIMLSVTYVKSHCQDIRRNNIDKVSTNVEFNKHCKIIVDFISDALKSLEFKD